MLNYLWVCKDGDKIKEVIWKTKLKKKKKETHKYSVAKHIERLRKTQYIDTYENMLEVYSGIFSVWDACFRTTLEMGGPDLLVLVLTNLVCCYLCFKFLVLPSLLCSLF